MISSVESSFSIASWFEKIIVVRQYEGEGHVSCSYPETSNNLSDIMNSDIEYTVKVLFSQINTGKLFWRLRDRSLPGFSFRDESDEEIGTSVTNATIFYNCFISISSSITNENISNEPNFTYKEAIVLISRWPFRDLSYEMLEHLQEAIKLQTRMCSGVVHTTTASSNSIFSSPKNSPFHKHHSLSSSAIDDTVNDEDGIGINGQPIDLVIQSVLEVAFNQISSWPSISPGSFMDLNFLGDVLNFAVPSQTVIEELNPRLTPLLLSINLLETFGALGLIRHLWTIWELAISGQDIVVVASNPMHCCEIVLAIASLLEPVGYVGDIRPYIAPHDKELLVLAATAQLKVVYRYESQNAIDEVEITTAFKKLAARNRSMVVGVTDIKALNELEDFTAAIFVDSTEYLIMLEKRRKFFQLSHNSGNIADEQNEKIQRELYQGFHNDVSDAVYKGMRNRNSAIDKYLPAHYTSDSKISFEPLAKRKRGFSRFLNFKVRSDTNDEPSFFSQQYQLWQNQPLKEIGGRKRTWILLHTRPTSIPLIRIIKRIQQLHPDDRVVFGDKMLRDNLQDITSAFLGANDSSEGRTRSTDTQVTSRVSIDGSTPEDQEAMEELLSQRRSLEMAREAELKGMWQQGLEDILDWVRGIPRWIVFNFATVVLWIFYLVSFGALAWLGVPSVAVVIVAYLIKVPDTAPETMVHVVESILPLGFFKNLYNKNNTVQQQEIVSNVTADKLSRSLITTRDNDVAYPDFNGVWKRVKVDNAYEAFLAAQGVNFIQRKIVASVAMQHTIVIDTTRKQLHLEEKGGPIDIETDYEIDPTKFKATHILKAAFEETLMWDFSFQSPEELRGNIPASPKLLIVKKRLPDCAYELRVWRWVEFQPQGRFLCIRALYHPLEPHSHAHHHNKQFGTVDIESYCTFEYVGPASFEFTSDALMTQHDSEGQSMSLMDDDRDFADNRVPDEVASSKVEEEILTTVSVDVITSPSLEDTPRKSWLRRRFSSKSNMKESRGHDDKALTPTKSREDIKRTHSSNEQKDEGKRQSDSHLQESSSSKKSTKTTPIPFVDFSGTWIRTRTENFEAFAEATGLRPLQRKVAAQMSLTHIITMNPPELSMMRLQERGGPMNTDFTVSINSNQDVAVLMNGKRLLHRAWYMEANMLVMFRRAEDGSFEHVLIRSLDLESSATRPQLILRSIHRDLQTGKEVEAISFFSKVGPSPNPPPQADSLPNLKNGGSPSKRFFFQRSPRKNDEMKSVSRAKSLDAAPETPSLEVVGNMELNIDCDEDDDDAALKKMRSISTVQKERRDETIKRNLSQRTFCT